MPAGDLDTLPVRQLLAQYADIVEALRRRGVTRSSNNPVADYTEHLVCLGLGLERAPNSRAGHDATDAEGQRYQIKGRRLTPQNPSTELSAIRRLDTMPFHFLVAVVFRPDFSVDYAAQIPVAVVAARARFTAHTNSHRFQMRRSDLDEPLVLDITSRIACLPV